ncbi:Crp/Fnr family transcriptional regulator [Cupriavidus necator]|uniref:Crp/Fnr family transcriptional regulator n=1 Tax=Cupriavidus necator TaxID=106590 RepID=A0A367PHZ0_CUPNE|nr:Crp/Fnr family transcriptional regulator [Cupriavidus necator]QQX82771.1 Crp/Fnr family transcriptional regulator [Cupriavidus necator]RCJ07489.1 Crp/Fnr family transcriptional regulator [Cupriavidus necator]
MKKVERSFLEEVSRFRNVMMSRYRFNEATYLHMLDTFSQLAQPVAFRKGELLQHQGVLAHSGYWIMSGVARTGFITEDGADVTLRFAAEGEMAGAHEDVLAAAVGLQAKSFVVAEQPLKAYKLDCPTLRRLLAEGALSFEVSARFLEYNLRKQARRAYITGLASARDRLAAFREEYPGLEARVTQKCIASYLAITPQYLSQISKEGSRSDAQQR